MAGKSTPSSVFFVFKRDVASVTLIESSPIVNKAVTLQHDK